MIELLKLLVSLSVSLKHSGDYDTDTLENEMKFGIPLLLALVLQLKPLFHSLKFQR